MKKHFSGIIVVEGKSDVSLLSQYIDAEYVTTNGSAINNNVIEYLKSRVSNTKIVVLTDPDSPGKRIRDIIEQNVPGVSHCFIEKKHAIKKNKVGVAECDINHLIESLNNIVTYTNKKEDTITMSELYSLGVVGNNSDEKKNIIADYYHLGHVNAKTLLKRLNGLGITKEELKKII